MLLSAISFNRSVMIRGIRSHRDLCDSFDKQDSHLDANGNRDPFPCFAPGATALNVCNSAIALATSFLISSVISSNASLRIIMGIWGVVMFVAVLGFMASYKDEMFHLEDGLARSGHTRLARHLGIIACLLTLICSLILAAVSALEPSVQATQTGT
jgi:hypothetical protein